MTCLLVFSEELFMIKRKLTSIFLTQAINHQQNPWSESLMVLSWHRNGNSDNVWNQERMKEKDEKKNTFEKENVTKRFTQLFSYYVCLISSQIFEIKGKLRFNKYKASHHQSSGAWGSLLTKSDSFILNFRLLDRFREGTLFLLLFFNSWSAILLSSTWRVVVLVVLLVFCFTWSLSWRASCRRGDRPSHRSSVLPN